MIIQCNAGDQKELLAYLEQEAVCNTFVIADIINYGFEQDFQIVYKQTEDERKIQAIYLKFYNNFIIAGDADFIDMTFIQDYIAKEQPAVIMGKAAIIQKVHQQQPAYNIQIKPLYSINSHTSESGQEITVTQASLQDVDRIHEFLMSLDEMKSFYGSKDMIESRIRTGDGRHYFIEQEGRIVAHANSTATNPYTVMIGGVGTVPDKRGLGLAKILVNKLTAEIMDAGKQPCLFCKPEQEHNLYVDLGFKVTGEWAVMSL